MSTSPIQLPPLITPIVDPKSGLASIAFAMWQQQLLQSRSPWTPYVPTVTHLSALTVNDCAYVQLGKSIHVRIGITGTSDGSDALITLPFKAKSQNQTFAAADVPFTNTGLVLMQADLLTLQLSRYDGASPANNSVHGWVITGVYEGQ